MHLAKSTEEGLVSICFKDEEIRDKKQEVIGLRAQDKIQYQDI